jgi:hypothetical protein
VCGFSALRRVDTISQHLFSGWERQAYVKLFTSYNRIQAMTFPEKGIHFDHLLERNLAQALSFDD